jgi:16S rRNA (cytosine967-C5)-methyltransferase
MSAGARSVAGRVLWRVAEEAAWVAPTLDAECRRARLAPRDAALAAQIAYGTLRVVPALDRAIDAQLDGDPARLDPRVRAALRGATFQLFHLARVPPHAVVDETVTSVRRSRGAGLAGLANAVLRKLAGARPAEPRLPARLVVPAWLEAELGASLGPERVEAVLACTSEPPPLGLRVRFGADRERIARAIREERPRAEVAHGALAPCALMVRRVGDPRTLRAWNEGAFVVQEEGSQLVALAPGTCEGERVADVCAGHGGKTTWLLHAVGARGRVTAIDVDARKLAALAKEVARLGLDATRLDVRAADMAAGLAGLAGTQDRVLVDAPCTGSGTILRRPELLLRLSPTDPARFAETQLRIATAAAALVRPGGTLAYVVCSLARAEGAGVAERLERALPDLTRARTHTPPLPAPDADGVVRVGPWLGAGTASRPDGYQLVRWTRT